MMSNDVVTKEASVVPSLKNMSVEEIAALTGQEMSGASNNQGLPRLGINHSEEDSEGRTISRGKFALKLPSLVTAYAKEAHVRIFYRLYTYSRWDADQNTFGSSTANKPFFYIANYANDATGPRAPRSGVGEGEGEGEGECEGEE